MDGPALPVGVTQSGFDAAMAGFEAVVGHDQVFRGALDRESYEDAYAVHEELHRPLGAVAPASTEEVRAVVRIAAEHGIPLWPISRGKNLGYGGSAPLLSGSLVLDLSRMKRIEIDVENATVLVEPGVGFYDLYEFLEREGIDLWLSVPSNGWGSVMGNALDRGMGYTPYGEHASKICGLEVVLPDGDLVRTGMGAMSGSRAWQLYRYGYGPAWDQVFSQSNYGVVTKLGLWLMPAPEAMVGLDVECDREDDLEPLIDAITPLRREGILQQSPTVGNWLRAATVVTRRSDWTDRPGPLSGDVIDAIRKQFGIGWWSVGLRVYGREAVARSTMAILEDAVGRLRPLSVKRVEWRRGEPLDMSYGSTRPSTHLMQNANWHGGRGGHIGFSPVLPSSGRLALEQYRRTKARCEEFGVDGQSSFVLGERFALNVNSVLFSQDDPVMLARIDPFMKALIADAKELGYGEYRTHLDYMDDVAATYDFNDHALRRLNQRVKDALDPKGIIASGKSGIWPTRRDFGARQ